MKNAMTNIVNWLDVNGYKPPFSRETLTKSIVALIGMAPSTVHGYLRIMRRSGVMIGVNGPIGLKAHVLHLGTIEKLEGTDLSDIKKKWKAK